MSTGTITTSPANSVTKKLPAIKLDGKTVKSIAGNTIKTLYILLALAVGLYVGSILLEVLKPGFYLFHKEN